MKCQTDKCHASCCYNLPFDRHEHLAFKDRIVNPIIAVTPLDHQAALVHTNPDPAKNRCPFLTSDYKCNIYEHRPDVCRKFGQIKELKCKYIKK